MAILPILIYGDSRLRQPARVLTPDEIRSTDIHRLIDDMFETMESSGGCGLAAAQVGYPYQLFIAGLADDVCERIPEARRQVRGIRPIPQSVFINAIVRDASDATDYGSVEGCLSKPGVMGPVIRKSHVTVRSQDQYGATQIEDRTDWFACIIQHEHDHGRGVLYTDHVRPDLLLPISEARAKYDHLNSQEILDLIAASSAPHTLPSGLAP